MYSSRVTLPVPQCKQHRSAAYAARPASVFTYAPGPAPARPPSPDPFQGPFAPLTSTFFPPRSDAPVIKTSTMSFSARIESTRPHVAIMAPVMFPTRCTPADAPATPPAVKRAPESPNNQSPSFIRGPVSPAASLQRDSIPAGSPTQNQAPFGMSPTKWQTLSRSQENEARAQPPSPLYGEQNLSVTRDSVSGSVVQGPPIPFDPISGPLLMDQLPPLVVEPTENIYVERPQIPGEKIVSVRRLPTEALSEYEIEQRKQKAQPIIRIRQVGTVRNAAPASQATGRPYADFNKAPLVTGVDLSLSLMKGRWAFPIPEQDLRDDWRERGFTCVETKCDEDTPWKPASNLNHMLITVAQAKLKITIEAMDYVLDTGDEILIPEKKFGT